MEEAEKEVETFEKLEKNKISNSAHLQVYGIVTGKDPSWHDIIYELIHSEQLDPWDVDIGLLCKSYFEKIRELEENNFYVSSNILLAAALLLRIKSEFLLNKYIREIDNVLYNRDEKIDKIIERIELDEGEIPILSPKTPMSRFKKVTLNELMSALDNAIKTENRRINREIEKTQAGRLSYVDIPKVRRINIRERIRQFYARVLTTFKNKKAEIKLPYSHFTGNNKEEKIACFLPMLHLSNNNKLWLEQDGHFQEIFMYIYDVYKKKFPEDKEMASLKEEIEEELMKDINGMREELDDEQLKRVEKLNKDFENPLADLVKDGLGGGMEDEK
jgi:segregation and condensation protein A